MRYAAVISGKYGGLRAMLPMIRLFEQSIYWRCRVFLCDQHARDSAEEVLTLADSELIVDGIEHRVCNLFLVGRELAQRFLGDPPNVIIVYGDRLDALVGASVGQQLGIPVAHLQAGDLSGGTDNATRYAVSALASWGFCSTNAAQHRVESALSVWSTPFTYVVGDHHIDAVLEAEKAGEASPVTGPYVVLHHHSDTLVPLGENLRVIRNINAALAGWDVVAMRPCTDPMGEDIWAETNARYRFDYMPLERYVALLKGARALVGNTSAILLDAPALGVPSLLVGGRQTDREGPEVPRVSGLDIESITRALDTLPFFSGRTSIMGDGNAGARTFDILSRLVP